LEDAGGLEDASEVAGGGLADALLRPRFVGLDSCVSSALRLLNLIASVDRWQSMNEDWCLVDVLWMGRFGSGNLDVALGRFKISARRGSTPTTSDDDVRKQPLQLFLNRKRGHSIPFTHRMLSASSYSRFGLFSWTAQFRRSNYSRRSRLRSSKSRELRLSKRERLGTRLAWGPFCASQSVHVDAHRIEG
jgi:hypothetical protein